ncbi:hypothetical protein KC799_16915, partial [candidate division KSB1 bacterium]|nr:hypothetical protein [candidate division KSB1 bacterium]
IAEGTQLTELDKIFDEALISFKNDLLKITKSHRIVWIIDTTEKLRYETSQFLLDNRLLDSYDLRKRTQQWLQDFIESWNIQNVTLLLAGRGKEGKSFFENIAKAVNDAKSNGIKHLDIKLSELSQSEIREYFAHLAKDQRHRSELGFEHREQMFNYIARDENERADVLWLYTGGIPVRLALYAQIIIEGHQIPRLLSLSWKEATRQAETEDPTKPTDALRRMQWGIEDQFINLLFHNPTNTRTRILQTLVRAPRGLNAIQLHYILDNHAKLPPTQWQPDPDRLYEITKLLNSMTNYYLVKRRSSWEELTPLVDPEEERATTFRLGLQDEIYRIFAEHMAPHAEPVDSEALKIFDSLNDSEKVRYYQNREDEQIARRDLFKRLQNWAAYQLEHYLDQKRASMREDERRLEEGLIPDRRRTFHFPILSSLDIQQRNAINSAINTFTVEKMVYELLLDPERNLNESYIDLGTSMNKANNFRVDFWAQSELWELVYNEYSLKFNDFNKREAILQSEESNIEVLQRAVVQEDVSRWLKRMVLLGEYSRAIKFAERVEKIIRNMPKSTPRELRTWRSWNHSLVHAERGIWACYARIYQSQEMSSTLKEIEWYIEKLELLLQHTVNEVAIVREDGYEEKGFRSVGDNPAHPAWTRTNRLTSLAYNTLGYGSIMYGRTQDAVRNYSHALRYIRGDEDINAHRAVILNNLSRALSDMGRPGSISVCHDSLNLRRQLAEEVPLAFSFNTLALIYDDVGRYEDAPLMAAKAIAYFERAGEKRGLGLASWQLGESLRHLAHRAHQGEMAQTTPASLYTTARDLLLDAHQTFEKSREMARFIALKIELGSLYRDFLDISDDKVVGDYRAAQDYLTQAMDLAEEHNLPYLSADAGVNLARTHFAFNKESEADAMVKHTEDLILAYAKKTAQESGESIEDYSWALRQLSRLQMIRGWIALAGYQRRSKHFKEIESKELRHQAIREDSAAQIYLQEAARAYSEGLNLAESFSHQSNLVQTLTEDLYNRVKAFSQAAIDDLYKHIKVFQEEKPNIHRLDVFLDDFLGVSKSPRHLNARE